MHGVECGGGVSCEEERRAVLAVSIYVACGLCACYCARKSGICANLEFRSSSHPHISRHISSLSSVDPSTADSPSP
eukprot:scaffold75175_cov58-Cyclotella_meneghiniana.AAC.1